MSMRVIGQIATGRRALDNAISDLLIVQGSDGGRMVYAGTSLFGGVSAWRVLPGLPTLAGTVQPSGPMSWHLVQRLTVITRSIAGEGVLVAGGGRYGSMVLPLDPQSGGFGSSLSVPITPHDLGRIRMAVELPDSRLAVADAGLGQLRVVWWDGQSYRNGGAIADTPTTHLSQVVALNSVTVAGRRLVIAADAVENGLTVLSADPGEQLQILSSLGPPSGLGLMSPTAMETVQIAGKTYVIVASAANGAGGLTVFELAANGTLTPTDHLLDSLHTRFGQVQDIAVFQSGGKTFIAAGGGDDGVTLFALLPGGHLVTLAVQEDTTNTGLMDVSALALLPVDGRLQLWAAGQDVPGISILDAGVRLAGQVLNAGSGGALAGGQGDDWVVGGDGRDSLVGGGGDDLIYDGGNQDTLWGGMGADLFVLAADGVADHIADFDPRYDRLDLSAWQQFYDPAQLTITIEGRTARLTWRNEVLTLTVVQGVPLSDEILRRAVVQGAHRVPVLTETVITGTGTGDNLTGSVPWLTIYGSGGNDSIIGGNWADTLFGGTGDDSMQGGGGSDSLYGNRGNDLILGHAGDDLLSGDVGNDTLYGHGGNDVISGDNGADELYGGEGSDQIYGGAHNDLIHAGSGNDFISGGTGSDTVWLEAGDDRYVDTDRDGALGQDDVWGGLGNDTILTGSGNDRLHGGWGNDVLDGQAGKDFLSGALGHDTMRGGAGDDTLYGDRGNDLLEGGDGNDLIAGGADNDRIYGGNGHDSVYGGLGRDRVWLGLGDDYYSDRGQQGVEGRDTVWGSSGNDTILTGGGDDQLFGGWGNDVLYGEAGNDLLSGARGHDALHGSWGNDLLYGDDGNDFLDGGDDHDGLYGGAGSDVILGGTGNDTADGGFGADLARLGFGNDLYLDNAEAGIQGRDTVFGESGNDTILTGGGDDQLFGGWGDDRLYGQAGNDLLSGGRGNDILEGHEGRDSLWADDGADLLRGGNGNDALGGGGGNDTLDGGAGADWLHGGAGADLFVFTIGSGHDTIAGFEAGLDRLQFSGVDPSHIRHSIIGADTHLEWDGGHLVLAGIVVGFYDLTIL